MKLKEMRTQCGMSRKKLSTESGVTVRALISYEQGTRRPSPEVAQKIAAVLNLTLEELWAMFYSDGKTGSDATAQERGQ